MADLVGKTILHYRIIEQVGQGGMGVVYKAEDTKLKREVAIKFLPRQITASDDERSRFRIEAQAAAALNHPNIATIHAIEENGDEMFILMEYIEGEELASLAKVLNLRKVLDYATQIASGLQAAHKNGIVHRDIKSSNIMITEDGQVKIMDFGLDKIRGGAQFTKVGTTLGTAAYMSPEQAVIYSILNEDPEPLTELREDISDQHLEKALSASRKAFDLDPDLPEAHASLGPALAQNKEFETALQLDPKLFDAYYEYARTCKAQGKHDQAAKLFEKATQIAPENFEAALFLVTSYDDLNLESEMKKANKRALAVVRKQIIHDNHGSLSGAGKTGQIWPLPDNITEKICENGDKEFRRLKTIPINV